MKRNRITWVIPITVLCLLATACSKDNNEPADAKTRSLTVGCGIGTSTLTPGTRAGVTPGNPDRNEEKFIWHKDDAFDGWLVPQEGNNFLLTSATFAIDEKYSDNAPSKSALFTCSNFPTESASYKMLATYPANGFQQENDGFTYTVNASTQIGCDNTGHLGKSMVMYATTTVTSANEIPTMTFHHLLALLRFTVKNENTSACRIKKVSIMSQDATAPVFGTSYSLKVDDWERETITYLCTNSVATAALTTQSSSTDPNGIVLSAAGATDKPNAFDAYMMVGPNTATPLTDQKLLLEIRVTDADGTSNERSYISLAINGNNILAGDGSDSATTWEPGKRYWFNLVLDDALTVTLNGVSDIPGWEADNEL